MRNRHTYRISLSARAEIPPILKNSFSLRPIHLFRNRIPIQYRNCFPAQERLTYPASPAPLIFLSRILLTFRTILCALSLSHRAVSIIPTSFLGHSPKIKAVLHKSLALVVPGWKNYPGSPITMVSHFRYDISSRKTLKLCNCAVGEGAFAPIAPRGISQKKRI